MKKTLSSLAAAAVLMASTAAFAQTAAPASPSAPATNSTAPSSDATGGAMAPAKPMASSADAGSYITQQSETQISANDYIGKSIYNANNESIGDVNDLLFEQNGGIVAAVVGVGGFLGIGEKDVALPIAKITTTQDAKNNGELRLTTTETADALKSAPEFKTLADSKAATDATTTSSTTPATTGAGATNPSTAPTK